MLRLSRSRARAIRGEPLTIVEGQAPGARSWTFLTNHARVLVEIACNPQSRLRDLAAWVGITERAAQAIVNDLQEAGYITRTRIGRRNHYTVDATLPFRHPADAGGRIEGLLSLFTHHDHAVQPGDVPAPAESTHPQTGDGQPEPSPA
jgi:hypothetical protein